MPNQNATTAIFIDKFHPKANGKCAVSLRVTFERKKKYYPTPISLTYPKEFGKVQGERPKEPYKSIALTLQSIEKKAADIIDKMPYFTWVAFEKQFLTNRGTKDSLNTAFDNYIAELKEADRIGTAVSYGCAKKSINEFSPDTKFADVTPDFLRKYEKWMLEKGNSISTVGIYLRSLRTLFNNAISEGMLTKEFYPFGKRKYEIPASNNVKKALTLKDIASIYYYKTQPGTFEAMARDFWIFMYLCNGINVKDMCLLKYKNLEGDVIEFVRAKTVRTKRKVEPIRIALVDDARDIIKWWGNKKKDGDTFIFPILTGKETPERERQLIQQLTGVINDHMKAIGEDLKIKTPITTYVARHSFSSILQRSGASTEFISEALGHSNIHTTQNYLAGFEDEKKKEAVKPLTAFKLKPSKLKAV